MEPTQPIELTEDEKKAAAEKARIELLQVKIKEHVKDLLKTDFTVHEIGYAADLYKGWITIMTHGTEQYDTMLKGSQKLNDTYLDTKVCDLISIRTEDEKLVEKN